MFFFHYFAGRNLPKMGYTNVKSEERNEELSPTNDDSVYHLDYSPPKKNRPVHN